MKFGGVYIGKIMVVGLLLAVGKVIIGIVTVERKMCLVRRVFILYLKNTSYRTGFHYQINFFYFSLQKQHRLINLKKNDTLSQIFLFSVYFKKLSE